MLFFRCNGYAGCPGGEDEKDCQVNCQPDQFACDANQLDCVSNDAVCDGVKDCPNGMDEDPEKCGT